MVRNRFYRHHVYQQCQQCRRVERLALYGGDRRASEVRPRSGERRFTCTNATSIAGAALITRAYEAGFAYPFSPIFSMRAGYTYIDQQDGKFHLVTAAGLDYRLPKLTDANQLAVRSSGFERWFDWGEGRASFTSPKSKKPGSRTGLSA